MENKKNIMFYSNNICRPLTLLDCHIQEHTRNEAQDKKIDGVEVICYNNIHVY